MAVRERLAALQVKAVIVALFAAAVAVQVVVDEVLLFEDFVVGGVDPLPVGGPPTLYGAIPAGQQASDLFGELGAVLGLGGDVVGGAGLLVAGADDLA